MLRTYVIFILALAIFSAMVGRLHSDSSSRKAEIVQQPRDRQPGRWANAEARNAPAFTSQDGTIELQRNDDGHFYADVRINGTYVHMLVDTGASGIALSRDDARSAGIATSIGMNDVVGEGADGAVHGEFVQLEKVELGPLSAEGLDAIILNSGHQSLLGQSFLSKFANVQIEGNRMLLR